MGLIYLLLLMSINFASYDFLSNYLIKKNYYNSFDLKIPNDVASVKFRLVEIFSPSAFINLQFSNKYVPSVLQANFIIANNYPQSIRITSYSGRSFWYRIINASDIVPGNNPTDGSIYLKATENNSFYTTVEFYPAQTLTGVYYWLSYEIWIIPIFPNGLFTSWSSDYRYLRESSIISVVNQSISQDYVTQRGIYAGDRINKSNSTWLFNMPNRKTYTNLIIIRAKVNDDIHIQYPPLIIYGCSSLNVFSSSDSQYTPNVMQGGTKCTPVTNSSWYILLCCISGFGILFILIGHYLEPLQFFVSGWIFLTYAGCIGFHYWIKSIYESGNYLYGIVFGVSFPIAFILSIFCCCCCDKKSRCPIMFNILCIIIIQWSIIWFALENLVENNFIIYVSNGVLSLIIMIFLIVFKGFTATFGSTFIGLTLTCCGFSLVLLRSSSMVYLFLDLFNFIVTRTEHINYYSLFLWDDLIIFCLWILLTIVFGLIVFKSRQRRKSKVKSVPVQEIRISQLEETRIQYGTITLNTNTIPRTQPEISESPPPYVSTATAPAMVDMPPPYAGLNGNYR